MKIELKLQPFKTPYFVLSQVAPKPRDRGFEQVPSFPLSDLDPEALSAMCDEFRAEVFEKAGKQYPRSQQ